MDRAIRNSTLMLLEGDDSLVEDWAEVRVVRTGERELELGLLSILSEFRGEIAVFPKIYLVRTNSANDDAVKRHCSFYIFTVNREDVIFCSSPSSSGNKVVGCRILGKQEEFLPLEGTIEC